MSRFSTRSEGRPKRGVLLSLSILPRRHTVGPAERTQEGGIVREPAPLGGFAHALPLPEQLGGQNEPLLEHILVDGTAGDGLEPVHQPAAAQVEPLPQLVHRQIGGQIVVDIAQDLVDLGIGTGVGMGIISNGKLLHGMLHPEGGHVLLTRHPKDTYGGKCPYHSNCLEGLAAGPAIEARWGKKGIELADKKEVWELEAYYIGQALVDCIMLLSPQRIVLGGGVMHQEHMMPLVREEVKKQLNGYLVTKELEDLDSYIVLPSLNDNQGIMGALKLAVDELAMQ